MTQLETVFSVDSLNNSWKRVKEKGKSGGIDNITISEFESKLEANLTSLSVEICQNKYIPEPYKRIFIEKNTKGYRPLALLTIRDKILQIAFLHYYRERIEKSFANTSYAYRQFKGHGKAINRINDFLMRGYKWCCPVDIDNYFDSIDRKILIEKCNLLFNDSYLIKLLEMWIRIGVIYRGKYIDSEIGIAQGGVISPFLSNIYLDSYDKAMMEKKFDNVRYADNILLISRNKEMLREALLFTKQYLKENLKLSLNKIENENINTSSEKFTFCGIQFFNKKRIIDPVKLERIFSDISKTFKTLSLTDLITPLNHQIAGIKRYYSAFDTEEQICSIENHIIKELSKKVHSELGNNSIISIKEAATILGPLGFLSPKSNFDKKELLKKIIIEVEDRKKVQPQTSVKHAINKQKTKHQKIWYDSLDMLISVPFAKIGKSGHSITVRKDGKIRNEISVDRIKNILISSKSVTISSDAVKLCAEKNIRINYFDDLGRPYASIISSAVPLSSVIAKQTEIINSMESKIIAKNIVYSKIKNQMSLMKYFIKNKNTDEINSEIGEELNNMAILSEKVKYIDLNLNHIEIRQKLMGFEGSAAVAYWKLFGLLIPRGYCFKEREHQNAKNIVNMMLNYAYGILYTRVLSAISVCGLSPNISYLHSEQKNKPTLVFDLIELFRAPVADRAVIAILQKGIKVKTSNYLLDEKTKSLLAKKVLYRLNAEFKHRGQTTCYNQLILDQAKELVAYIKNEKKVFKTFLLKW